MTDPQTADTPRALTGPELLTIQNDFLAFAMASGANVQDQPGYAASAAVTNGFISGIAQSAPINKALRQGTIGTAALAAYIVNMLGIPVLDDGNLTEFVTNFTNALGGGKLRVRLQANTNLYVNASTGSDTTGNGSASAPWQTLQHAYNQIQDNWDMNGYSLTVNCTGAFTAGLLADGLCVGQTGPRSLIFNGVSGASVTVGAAQYGCFEAADNGQIQNFVLSNTNAAAYCVRAAGGYLVVGAGITFAASAGVHVQAIGFGLIWFDQNFTITGGAQVFFSVTINGVISMSPGGNIITCTISGTPNFSNAFVVCDTNSTWSGVYTLMVFSGAATGVRYKALNNGVIWTNGASTTYFPGNAAGTTTAGGQYV